MAVHMTISKRNGNGSAPPPAVVASITPSEIMEQVLAKGDLKNLSDAERNRYYIRVCESLGLNPLTRPLQYIDLKGKLTLYAGKDCAAQLRKLHNVSIDELTFEAMGDVHIAVCKVSIGNRTDVARGAVTLKGLTGEALANQIMRCETKAKNRATYSICGMGFLDETEVEDITPEPKQKGWRNGRKTSAECKRDGTNEVFNEIRRHIAAATDLEFLARIARDYETELQSMYPRWSLVVAQDYELKWADLGGDPSECPYQAEEERG
jgi:hypothetical protein